MKPENGEAHNNLARLLTSQRLFVAAVGEFEQALRLNPDAVSPLTGLAWVRAVAGDASVRQPDEAVRLAERAATLSNRKDPAVLDALAASYASAQQFDKAMETVEEAMQLADAMGLQGLWVDIRARAKLYEQKQVYIAR